MTDDPTAPDWPPAADGLLVRPLWAYLSETTKAELRAALAALQTDQRRGGVVDVAAIRAALRAGVDPTEPEPVHCRSRKCRRRLGVVEGGKLLADAGAVHVKAGNCSGCGARVTWRPPKKSAP